MNALTSTIVRVFAHYETLSPEPIFEFGSMQVEGQEGTADMRPYFPGKKYIGCDLRAGLGVDRIEDVQNIDLPDDSIGTSLSLCTLEHVQSPEAAIKEMIRVTAGTVMIVVPFNYPVHEYPSDYWRMTPECMNYLLRKYAQPNQIICVFVFGTLLNPDYTLGMIFKKKPEDFDRFYSTMARFCTIDLKHAEKMNRLKKYLPARLVDWMYNKTTYPLKVD